MKLSEVDLRGKTSGQVKTFCPLCRDTRRNKNDPSLSVNIDDSVYDCHHCGENGRFEDAPLGPRQFVGKEQKNYKKPDPVALAQNTELLDKAVLEYFEGRGISGKTVLDWGITVGPSFMKRTADGRVERLDGVPVYLRGIRFPYYENGELVWMKHLRPREWNNGERLIKSFEDGKPVPFGLDRKAKTIYIVEGEIDALSFAEVFEDSDEITAWSVPNGAKSFGWLDFESVVDRFSEAEQIIIAGDMDNDGVAMREELLRRLQQAFPKGKLGTLLWPENIKDANEFLKARGKEAFREYVLSETRGLPVDGISEADEFFEEFFEFYDNGVPRGVSTGMEPLDEIYRVMPGMVTVITGVTNYGKSEIMDEIVRNMIEKEGWKFAFYSPENFPMSLHMIKLAEKYIGKPYDRSKPGAMTREEAYKAALWIKENIFYINPRNTVFSVDEIIERAKVLIYRKGIQGLIIDPWNYIRKDFNGLREDQFINQEMQKLGVFGKATGVHTWATVHPRTLKRDKNDKIQVPTVMELSGGSKFGDNADFIFAVHRDPQQAFDTGIHEVTVHVQKSRYKYAAKQGHVTMEWIPENGRFKALGEKSKPVFKPVPQEDVDEYVFDPSDEF